ncbi:hypothetical protein TNCV_1466251 [Trichonephila clavipes]|nr:hypothetical protein TNCV_1466251 [Trichonephila clavipes]
MEGTSPGLPQKSYRLLAGGASQRHPQNLNLPLGLPRSLISTLSLSHPIHRLIILLIFYPFAAPVGLSAPLTFFSSASLSVSTPLICCLSADSVGLDTFHL